MTRIHAVLPALAVLSLSAGAVAIDATVSAGDYPSIQAAIDANPGRMVVVPGGDHAIVERLRIRHDNGGLCGYGRILQSNPAEPVLEIERAAGVRVQDLTLARAPGAEDAEAPGLLCLNASGAVIDGVRVFDCRARDAAITLRQCADCTIRNCEVRNYKRIAVDDRTADGETLYGYAFQCIDGTGILITECTGTIIEGNRIVEDRLLPTREAKERFGLGKLVEGRHPTRPGKLGETVVRAQYASNWHQGSAIVATGPEVTAQTLIRGNQVRNAAQGIDLHCDNAVVSENLIDTAMIGIKMTHGCRNLIVSGNLIRRVDLWGILLNPGAASHAAEPAAEGRPPQAQNVDAGIIIANNHITDFGYGLEYWNWGGASSDGGGYGIALYEGQLDTNPASRDVLISGNMVYDTGRDGILVDGKVETPPPRYHYAVYIGPWGDPAKRGPTFPQALQFAGNLFHPGSRGVSNTPLEEFSGPAR